MDDTFPDTVKEISFKLDILKTISGGRHIHMLYLSKSISPTTKKTLHCIQNPTEVKKKYNRIIRKIYLNYQK